MCLLERDNGNYHIFDDKYDFDIRDNNSVKNILRNIETYLGSPSGNGTPYYFKFSDKPVLLEGKRVKDE